MHFHTATQVCKNRWSINWLQIICCWNILKFNVVLRGCLHDTGTTFILVRLSYRYDFHTGTTFIPVRLSYWYDFHTGTTFIPVRLSYRYDVHTGTTFIPVRVQPGSYCFPVFVYMTPVRNFIPVRIIPVRVHPGSCTSTTFSFWDKKSSRTHVNTVRFQFWYEILSTHVQ